MKSRINRCNSLSLKIVLFCPRALPALAAHAPFLRNKRCPIELQEQHCFKIYFEFIYQRIGTFVSCFNFVKVNSVPQSSQVTLSGTKKKNSLRDLSFQENGLVVWIHMRHLFNWFPFCPFLSISAISVDSSLLLFILSTCYSVVIFSQPSLSVSIVAASVT